jgi:hypothetical protein
MREVRTCDFCDDEAAGTFEVVPPGRDPAGEGRRMVLCPGCRGTLASVLEPLLDGGGSGDADTGTAPDEGAGTGTGTTTVVAEPERDPDDGADAGPSSGTGAEAGRSDRSPSPGTDGVSPPTGEDDATDTTDTSDTTGGGDENAGEDFGAAIVDDESAEAPGKRRGSTRRGTPRGYRKVMRFLENREFPMDREEAETLAAEAYDMDPDAVSAAIDHAVKHNRLREASGDLFQ